MKLNEYITRTRYFRKKATFVITGFYRVITKAPAVRGKWLTLGSQKNQSRVRPLTYDREWRRLPVRCNTVLVRMPAAAGYRFTGANFEPPADKCALKTHGAEVVRILPIPETLSGWFPNMFVVP